MKTDEMLVLGAAAAAVYLIWNSTKKPATTTATPRGSTGMSDWVGEIFSSAGTPYSNGWRYYDNGTAIDPQGNYYYQGQLVYKAA